MGCVHDRPDNLRQSRPASAGAFDVHAVRRDFPILSTEMNGRPLVYLDNAATTQKPRAVIEAIVRYYESGNANIHRGVYTLSQQATAEFDRAREVVAGFLSGKGDILLFAGEDASSSQSEPRGEKKNVPFSFSVDPA